MATTQPTSNRSDVLRQRRTSQTGKAKTAPGAKRPTKSSGTIRPPLLVRGTLSQAYAPEVKRGKNAKRRYDVALGTQGVEMRLPSLPKVAIGWRLISGLLVGTLLVTLYSVWTLPILKVSAAEVEGLLNLKTEDINAIASVADQPVFLVQPGDIEDALMGAYPELSDVSVQVKLPAKVKIVVDERVPVITWRQESQNFWVDAEGIAFPERGPKAPEVLVEAEGALPAPEAVEGNEISKVAPRPEITATLASAVLAMAEEAPKSTPLVYSVQHGLGWKDPRGWQVYFGNDTQDMQTKLGIYKAIVKRLKVEEVQPVLISVEYIHAPYYRLEQ